MCFHPIQLSLAKVCSCGNPLGLESKACSDLVSQLFGSAHPASQHCSQGALRPGINDTMRYAGTMCFQMVRREWRLSVPVVLYNIRIWNTTRILLIKNLLDLFFLQVHPGRLARGGDHYEGFLQPYAACDSGLCRPLLGSTLCPKGSAPVTWNCLHGSLYTVRIHKYTILCMFHSILVCVGNLNQKSTSFLVMTEGDYCCLFTITSGLLIAFLCIHLFYLFISAAIWVKKSWPYVKLSG